MLGKPRSETCSSSEHIKRGVPAPTKNGRGLLGVLRARGQTTQGRGRQDGASSDTAPGTDGPGSLVEQAAKHTGRPKMDLTSRGEARPQLAAGLSHLGLPTGFIQEAIHQLDQAMDRQRNSCQLSVRLTRTTPP